MIIVLTFSVVGIFNVLAAEFYAQRNFIRNKEQRKQIVDEIRGNRAPEKMYS